VEEGEVLEEEVSPEVASEVEVAEAGKMGGFNGPASSQRSPCPLWFQNKNRILDIGF